MLGSSASLFAGLIALSSTVISSLANNLIPVDKQYPPVRVLVDPEIDGSSEIDVPLTTMELNENHELRVDRFVIGIANIYSQGENTYRVFGGPSDAYGYGCGFTDNVDSVHPKVNNDGSIVFELMPNEVKVAANVKMIYCMAIYTLDGYY